MPVDFQSSLASLLHSFAMVASAVQVAKRALASLLHSFAMVASAVQVAKRALVSLLLALAQQYAVQIQLKREDDDSLVEAAFRKVVKRTHPDKGGKLAGQRLQIVPPTSPKVSSDLLPVQVLSRLAPNLIS